MTGWLLALTLARSMDAATSVYALQQPGLTEGVKWMPNSPAGQIALQAGVATGQVWFLQKMKLLIAQIVPDDDEVERPRLGDLFQPQQAAVKSACPFEIGDQHRDVIDLCNLKTGHDPSLQIPITIH